MGFLRWITGFIVAIVLAVFAVLNPQIVSVTWSPVHSPVDLPLYLVVFCMMAASFVFGGFSVWLNMGKLRRDRRQQKKKIKILERDLTQLQGEAASQAPAPELFSALSDRSHR